MPVNIIHSTQGICNYQLDKQVKRKGEISYLGASGKLALKRILGLPKKTKTLFAPHLFFANLRLFFIFLTKAQGRRDNYRYQVPCCTIPEISKTTIRRPERSVEVDYE